MSIIKIPVYKEEGGTMHSPAVEQFYNTNCTDTVKKKKSYQTVFIHFNSPNWVVDDPYVAGQSKVALKVTNPCTGQFAFLDIAPNDFRLLQDCCEPLELEAILDSETYSSGQTNDVSLQLGCDPLTVDDTFTIAGGANLAAALATLATYLNANYSQYGFFFVRDNTIVLLSANETVLGCADPTFAISISFAP